MERIRSHTASQPGPPTTLLCAGIYLAAALLLTWKGLGQRAVGWGVDLSGTLWYVEWIRHCLLHGVDPSWTPWFFFPEGKDIFAHTGDSFVDAILSQPFRAVLGWPGWFTPFVACVLWTNALAMHRLLQGRGISWQTSLAVSLVFEFHPFALHEIAQGRPTQVILVFAPLALHHLLCMENDARWRHPLAAGAFVALQAWTYWFDAHFLVIVLGPVLVTLLLLRRSWVLLSRMAVALGVAALLVAPALLAMILVARQGQVPGLEGAAMGTQGPELLTWWILAPQAGFFPVSPLFLLPIMFLSLLGCRPLLWGSGLLVGLLWMAGPTIPWGEHAVSNPLWSLGMVSLPFLSRLWFPYRGWALIMVLWSLPLAEGMERAFSRIPSLVGGFLAIGAGLLLSGLPSSPDRRLPITELPMPTYIDRVRAEPGVVMDLPFLCSGELIHLQPLHGQPLIGGMAEGATVLRPAGMMERVRDDPLLSRIAMASAGDRPLPPPPGALPNPPVRWVVLHKGRYRDLRAVSECWHSSPGDDPSDPGAQVQALLMELLGPPTVEDPYAAAWDIGRQRR